MLPHLSKGPDFPRPVSYMWLSTKSWLKAHLPHHHKLIWHTSLHHADCLSVVSMPTSTYMGFLSTLYNVAAGELLTKQSALNNWWALRYKSSWTPWAFPYQMYSMQLCRPSLRLPSRRAIMSLRKQGQQQNLAWVTQARYYIVHSVSASIAYFLKKDVSRSRITIWVLAYCHSQESFILWTGIVASSLQNCLWKRCAS